MSRRKNSVKKPFTNASRGAFRVQRTLVICWSAVVHIQAIKYEVINTNIGSSYLYTNIGPYYKSIGLSYISKDWFIIYMQILGHIIKVLVYHI